MDEMDRISPLPDCLLHFILSFLTTKESIITSVLSKRWINVWKSVPRLDLNFSDFNQPVDFETFVNSILHYKIFPNPEQLDTFNLTWHNCDESSYQAINTWIYNLPSLHPREVYLDVSKLSGVYFVSYLFNCPSLESLFLWAQIDAWAGIDPPVINLPFLKSLNIGWVSLEDTFMQRLINGCPVLEDLVFENCFLGVTQRIVSASLKTLVIKDTVFGQDTRLIISMPNLEYLLCQVHLGRVSFENLSSLEYASVNLWGMKSDYDGREVKLLRGLSNANSLQFSGYFVNHMMEKEAPNLPVFKNLECLDLASFTIREDLEPIDLFLRRTPNLEKLILQNISMTRHGVLCWSARFPGIRCDNLKTIEIVCLKSDKEMHQLVKYLPVHLKAIENISINRTDAINDYAPHLPMQEDSP